MPLWKVDRDGNPIEEMTFGRHNRHVGKVEVPVLKLTRTQIAEWFGVHPRTLRRWIESKTLNLTGDPLADLTELVRVWNDRHPR